MKKPGTKESSQSISSYGKVPDLVILLFGLILSPAVLSETRTLLKDEHFLHGVQVMSPLKDVYTGVSKPEQVIDWKDSDVGGNPYWRFVQWGSDKTIANTTPVALKDQGYRWASEFVNASGKVQRFKALSIFSKNNQPPSIIVESNALAEYSGPFYENNDALYLQSSDNFWPHLLLVQDIQSEKLNYYDSLDLSLDARLLFDHPNIQEGYQRGLHASRFVISIGVQNTLSKNLFWLMLVVYDDRFEKSGYLCRKCLGEDEENCVHPVQLSDPGRWVCPFDGKRWERSTEKKGTLKMLFRVPTDEFTDDNIHEREWSQYKINLLPFVKAGIEAARDQPDLSGFSDGLNFYRLMFFSMGWEMTGLNHAAIELKNIKFTGEFNRE